jgi:hypothetical protein
MDYDWLLRLHRAGGVGVYCPEVVAHMTHAGVSNRQFARTIHEVRQIVIAHGRKPAGCRYRGAPASLQDRRRPTDQAELLSAVFARAPEVSPSYRRADY